MITTNGVKNLSKLQRAQKMVDLFILCDEIYKLEGAGRTFYSPLRNDGRYPAFEIREDGQVCIDHGTGEGFNVLTLIERVEHLSRREAALRLIHYAETHVPGVPGPGAPFQRGEKPPMDPQELVAHIWPFLEIGSPDDYLRFGQLRGLDPVALISATASGLFHFFTDRNSNQRLCTVTDSARFVRQDRTLTGEDVLLSHGASKSRTIGKASWPVGAADIGTKRVVLLTEGMPDLLAAVQIIESAGRDSDAAAVAMLGAGQRIHPQALPFFAGKRVRVFPDNDPAGLKAGEIWSRQLEDVGANVDSFSMAAQEPALGSIKDLNDFVVAGEIAHDGEHVIPTLDNKEVAL